MLLPVEIDPIAEKQNHKKNALGTYGTGHVQIILALPTEIVAFHM